MSEARERKQVALLPGVLKASGYRVESRMVNDFTYMDMVATNFGEVMIDSSFRKEPAWVLLQKPIPVRLRA